MANIVPSFSVTELPKTYAGRGGFLPGQGQGVYITLPPDFQFILSKMIKWFEDRDEVELVDHGVSDKLGAGYIILEWSECEIDPLFIAMLRHEESVADYTVYVRDLS